LVSDDIHVSEDRLRVLLGDLKLELKEELHKLATRAELEALSGRVRDLELWKAGSTTLAEWQRWALGGGVMGLVAMTVTILLHFFG
jgi:hypothetical protein